ncbi:MAG: Calx-beta domain-containing protein, partial [Candidatus Hydrogenedentota bacterium]
TSFSDAADLGTINTGTETVTDMSLAGNFEADFYSFGIDDARSITVTLTPTGETYLQGPQTGSCDTGTSFNSLNQMNLELQLLATDGVSVLATADSTAAGSTEVIVGQDLFAAGTYFVRVFTDDANNNVQAYDLSVTAAPAGQGAPTVSFETGAFTVAETGNTAIVTVVLSGPAGAPVTVNFASSDGTATAGSDYTAVSGIMQFGPAETEKTFNVAVSDDLADEGNETVLLTVSGPSEGLSLGEPSSATLTITDNDTTTIASFSATAFPVSEGAGTLTITVNLSPAPTSAVAIDFDIDGVTATTGADIAGSTGTLQINPGDTTKLFAVSIVDDDEIEGTETATISLTNPSSGIAPGSPSSATISIEENDFDSITAIESSPNPSFFGQQVTFTATVAPDGDVGFVPSGMVTFRDGAAFLGTRTLNGSGVATLSTSTLSEGSHSTTAEYLGGGVFLGSTSEAVIHVVEQNRPPTFETDPPTAATPGTEYVYEIVATDPDPDDTPSVTGPVVPFWLTLDDNGDGTALLSGTPDQLDVGNHDVVLRANDGNGGTAEQSFTVVVSSDNDAPEIVSTAVTAGIVGEAYNYTLIADDPDNGDVLTFDAIQLPDWLTLSDNGDGTADLAGTPAEGDIGNNDVDVEVNDASGASDSQSFTIVVVGAGGNHAPTAIALSNNTIVEGGPAGTEVGVFTTTDADAVDTHTYSLVAGLGDDDNGLFVIDGDTLLTAAILDASDGDLFIRVRADDGNGGTFARIVELFVTRAPLELCDLLAQAENQYNGFRLQLQLPSDDFDLDFVPDLAALGLMERVACFGGGSGLATAAESAYAINLDQLNAEPDAGSMADRFELFAALMSISGEMQAALADILAGEGIVLLNEYTSVRCDGSGDCGPQLKGNIKEDFDAGAKALNEPFSGEGDLDEDGLANVEEFNNVVFSGGDTADYLDAAIDPAADGVIPGG